MELAQALEDPIEEKDAVGGLGLSLYLVKNPEYVTGSSDRKII